MIQEFLKMGDKVALVARPRRFGKTLNMPMLREFLDITRDSSRLFEGLAIMDTQFAAYMNSRPVLLVDEYDQPIMSSYEYGYHEELGTFFTNLYGMAMKGNDALDQALLTGVQRVVKESIFSQFNNPKVYTVFSRQYATSFGLTEAETRELLEDYGLTLNQQMKKKYDGYRMGAWKCTIPGPFSIMRIMVFWITTGSILRRIF